MSRDQSVTAHSRLGDHALACLPTGRQAKNSLKAVLRVSSYIRVIRITPAWRQTGIFADIQIYG